MGICVYFLVAMYVTPPIDIVFDKFCFFSNMHMFYLFFVSYCFYFTVMLHGDRSFQQVVLSCCNAVCEKFLSSPFIASLKEMHCILDCIT